MSNAGSTAAVVTIVKSATCPSVSGKSEIGYQVGRDGVGNVALRLASNTGGGFFSEEWVPLRAIEQVLQANATKNGLSSGALRTVFRGKSVNTAAFLLAVLKAEGAVRPREGKTRVYDVADFAGFVAALTAATASRAPRSKAGTASKKATRQAGPTRG